MNKLQTMIIFVLTFWAVAPAADKRPNLLARLTNDQRTESPTDTQILSLYGSGMKDGIISNKWQSLRTLNEGGLLGQRVDLFGIGA
jgi:hypothetical protein